MPSAWPTATAVSTWHRDLEGLFIQLPLDSRRGRLDFKDCTACMVVLMGISKQNRMSSSSLFTHKTASQVVFKLHQSIQKTPEINLGCCVPHSFKTYRHVSWTKTCEDMSCGVWRSGHFGVKQSRSSVHVQPVQPGMPPFTTKSRL